MERDNTPFGGAQNAGNGSQPQIFSTDQTSQDKQSISSKLGTSRSRFNSRANRYAEQQTNYSAAQSIAQNQNTPQFFSDAVMANTPVPVEPPKKSKAPLFIGLAVALVAVVAVVLVVTLMPKGETDDKKKEVIASTFNSDDIGNVNNLEIFYSRVIDGDVDARTIMAADYQKTVDNGAKSYRMILDNLKENKDLIDKEELSADLDDIISKMEANIVGIEKSTAAYDIIYSAFLEENKSKLDSISDELIKKSAIDFYDGISNFAIAASASSETDCFNATIIDPQTGFDECDLLEQKMDNAEEQIVNSNLAYILFIGEKEDSIKTNFVKSTLNDIYIKLNEAGIYDERKN